MKPALLAFSALWLLCGSASADPPAPADPFLAPAEEIRALIPKVEGQKEVIVEGVGGQSVKIKVPVQPPEVPQISVKVEWYRMPHAEIAPLLRKHLYTTDDANALRVAVTSLAATGKATLMDSQSMVVRSGQRNKATSGTEVKLIQGIDSPEPKTVDTPHGKVASGGYTPPAISATISDVAGSNLEIEANVDHDMLYTDINLAAERSEVVGEKDLSPTKEPLMQPLLHKCRLSTQLVFYTGHWQLAGLVTPPDGKEAATGSGFAPDRVLVLVQPSIAGVTVPEAGRPRMGRQALILTEWIETDTDRALALLDSHRTHQGEEMRRKVDAMLTAGTASLVETSAVNIHSGQRSNVSSALHLPVASSFDPPTMVDVAGDDQRPIDPGMTGRGITVPTPQSFETHELGTSMEAEVNIAEGRSLAHVLIGATISSHLGEIDWGPPGMPLRQPMQHFSRLNAHLALLPHRATLAGLVDPPLPPGGKQPEIQKRKLMVFVTAIF